MNVLKLSFWILQKKNLKKVKKNQQWDPLHEQNLPWGDQEKKIEKKMKKKINKNFRNIWF